MSAVLIDIRAVVEFRLGDDNQGLQDLEKAVKLEPKSIEVNGVWSTNYYFGLFVEASNLLRMLWLGIYFTGQ